MGEWQIGKVEKGERRTRAATQYTSSLTAVHVPLLLASAGVASSRSYHMLLIVMDEVTRCMYASKPAGYDKKRSACPLPADE